ncbi:hypothetical protein [Deinococcus sp. QL22]|uniref:hypothetical protein n=1 Tax=Deinococcus sp. QL22 TaxID=2939437 RepID=UPI00201786F0|nr:hypothetical protein [Deinococcus sp. QL22]UQN08438.1 hypothetical protein M1R55_17105 [Deinococcus sp. QL22]
MTNDDLPFQPSSLLKSGEDRKSLTLEFIKRAINERNKEQLHITEELRTFETKDLLRIANELINKSDSKRKKPIYKTTLSSNTEVASVIAVARRETFQAIPDFSRYASLKVNRSIGHRAQSRRRSYLIKHKSRDQLAQDVVGLMELDRFYTNRRELLDVGNLEEGPWPEKLPFPNDPFVPSAAAAHRYQQLRTHQRKADLAKMIIDLEKRISEHRQHLQKLDRLYLAQKPKFKPSAVKSKKGTTR